MRLRLLLLVAVSCVGCRLVGGRTNSPAAAFGLVGAFGGHGINRGCEEESRGRQEEDEIDSLGAATACLEKNDHAGAVRHFDRHLHRRPDQVMIRAFLAESWLKLGNRTEAARHFERFITDVQASGGPAERHLVHCHMRLMEIARQDGNRYGEHLHRGIGLYLLASRRQSDALGDMAFGEQLYCKAAAELAEAKKLRPQEARPYWYLAQVWAALGQVRPARRAERQAFALAPYSDLTPTERLTLALQGN